MEGNKSYQRWVQDLLGGGGGGGERDLSLQIPPKFSFFSHRFLIKFDPVQKMSYNE